ncbi:uncharacterized protein LOC122054951 [Zingiber officinale]|uniref:uncharacterized protein LOC122054951 n=1 Tax=Zingiber officinale TaxID=94328 RepID=UPI001C4D7CBB|nr:uncharacterized protein LOC122054951 [Zingiber officinale]
MPEISLLVLELDAGRGFALQGDISSSRALKPSQFLSSFSPPLLVVPGRARTQPPAVVLHPGSSSSVRALVCGIVATGNTGALVSTIPSPGSESTENFDRGECCDGVDIGFRLHLEVEAVRSSSSRWPPICT